MFSSLLAVLTFVKSSTGGSMVSRLTIVRLCSKKVFLSRLDLGMLLQKPSSDTSVSGGQQSQNFLNYTREATESIKNAVGVGDNYILLFLTGIIV